MELIGMGLGSMLLGGMADKSEGVRPYWPVFCHERRHVRRQLRRRVPTLLSGGY